MVAGAFNGFLVAYVGLPSLAVTIGTLALYRGIAVGLLGTEAVTDFPEKWTDLAKERIAEGSQLPGGPDPVRRAAHRCSRWLLHFTSFGRGVFEIGLNSEAAHFSGVNVERTKFWLFVLCGAVSAFAGIYYTLRYGSARGDNATGLELQVIAAVLLGGVSIFGGRGALHGVVAGVLLIGVISSAMRLENYTVNVINIVIGALLVLSVMTTSLLGRARSSGGPGERWGTPSSRASGTGRHGTARHRRTDQHRGKAPTMKFRNRRLSALAAVTLVAGLALSACGGDDGDDDASDGGGGGDDTVHLPAQEPRQRLLRHQRQRRQGGRSRSSAARTRRSAPTRPARTRRCRSSTPPPSRASPR